MSDGPSDLERLAALEERVGELDRQLQVLHRAFRVETRSRWEVVSPDAGLTWGVELPGNAFVDKTLLYYQPGPETVILEVGPGYGRILGAYLEKSAPFAHYCAIDISERVVSYLREKFPREDVEFVCGDTESVAVPVEFDLFLSSLTLKHVYPSFEGALRHIVSSARPGAVFVFDLLEGEGVHFDRDVLEDQERTTYVRFYSRSEVEELVEACGLELVAFDSVRHNAEHERLLVVARRSA